MFNKIRDWFRGYSDDDLASLKKKQCDNKSLGAITYLTKKEWNALIDNPEPWPKINIIDRPYPKRTNFKVI